MDEQQASAVPDQQSASTIPEKEKNVLMGILSYLGLLVIISYALAKDDPFVRFHMKQGFVLLAIEIVVWLVGVMLWQLWPLIDIIDLAVLVLSIVGIINVVQGNKKELPLVGKYASYVKI